MNYSIVRIKGKQYKVAEGDELNVNFAGKSEPEIEVLLQVKDGKVEVGTPLVEKAKVKVKVLESELKGTKVTVQKYKAKSRYRKKMGFRPKLTRLQIEKL